MSEATTSGAPAHPEAFVPLPRTTFVSSEGRHLHVYGEVRGRPGPDWPKVEPAALHRRFDALGGAWIAISPARNVRPHAADEPGPTGLVCPLCPGGPEVPFSYQAAVFDNRFPALVALPPAPPDGAGFGPALGRAEVVLYTEVHDETFADLEPVELARVVAVWRDRSDDLWADPAHAFVMAFENHGEAVGATLSHPHGQAFAMDHLPPFIEARVRALSEGRRASGACVTCAVAERDASERPVFAGEHFVVAVPFAPRWPYEVHVRARRHGLRRLGDLRAAEQQALATALRGVARRYDRLFGFELPYMMTIMEAPAGADDWHLAVEFLPPHRSERLTKVRASVETASGLFLNDTLPEASAERLARIEAPVEHEADPFIVVRAVETGAGGGERRP